MFFRSFNQQSTICWMWLLIMPCVALQAQDSPQSEIDNLPEPPSLTVDPTMVEADPLASGFGFGGETRDPTAPPSQLLERIPKPDPVEVAEPPKKASTTPTKKPVVRKAPAIIPLPVLPKISIRGIVLSTPDRGTAMLDVGGENISIELLPREFQQRIPIPDVQFAPMKAALDQRSAMSKQASDQTKSSSDIKQFEMCVQCSFAAEGTIFNLESFTRNALILRAIPHDTLIIVRR